MSYAVDEQRLEGLAGEIGNVVSVILGVDKTTRKRLGYAFVKFSTHEEAAKAYDHFNGYELDGRCGYRVRKSHFK